MKTQLRISPNSIRKQGFLKTHLGEVSSLTLFLKGLIGIVFLGWMMMWVLMPTPLWTQKWRPSLRSLTKTVYFGNDGATILVYTFPVMLISVLGCIYFHLKEKKLQLSDEWRKKDDPPSKREAKWKNDKYWGSGFWTRPVIVRGPCGVVSSVELAFMVMFLVLLIWCFAVYLYVGLPKVTIEKALEDHEALWQAKLSKASKWLGLIGTICAAFLFFPVSRGSILLRLLGLTFEGSVKYHMWLGHIMMTILTIHGSCFFVVWATKNDLSKMLEWKTNGVANLPGELAVAAGLILWIATLPQIRRKMFELFFYTHHLYVLFFVFSVFHLGPGKLYMFLPGFYLFVVDRFLRSLQSSHQVQLLAVRILSSEAVELTFCKRPDLIYNPMSTLFINVPSISSLEWHPFTITSSCLLEPEKLSIAVKCEGSWSRLLNHQILTQSHAIDQLEFAVEGPYEPPSTDFLRHDVLVMICGGIGITPFASIIRDMAVRRTPDLRVLLVCAFKYKRDLGMLDLLLPSSSINDEVNLNLKIQVYITREMDSEFKQKTSSQMIWLEPSSCGEPVSRLLGPHHWLWMGYIISVSFVLFLLLIAMFSRFYIYPKQQGTDYTYPRWRHGFVVMVFMCLSICLVGALSSMWSKRRDPKEGRRIKNVEDRSPMGMSGVMSQFSETDKEGSSLWSLSEVTKVQYGSRPDFKKILSEYEGGQDDVGVVVSGPQGMRSDVAAICSPNNLHFHAVSFEW